MGNSEVNKVLPAIDMLLVLVVIMFSTAGLVRSLTPPANIELQEEYKRLKDKLASKEELANNLDQKLQVLNNCSSVPLEKLQATLTETETKQYQLAQTEKNLAEVRSKLDQLLNIIEPQKMCEFLKDQIETLKQKIQQLEQERDTLKDGIAGIDPKRANIQVLQKKIDELNKEIERLKKIIKEVEEKVKKTSVEQGSPFGGSYTGPYVLLECDDKGVVVYPDKKRVPLKASDEEIDWLKQQIRAAGAAALVVRPSGFEESYAKFYKVLTDFADNDKAKDKTIILSFWPIEAEEAIEKYLRKE